MIYQHEARGADKAITDAIDTHVQGEQGQTGGVTDTLGSVGYGPLMAPPNTQLMAPASERPRFEKPLPNWAYVERVTGIEPALSAWEAERSRLL